MRNFKFIAVGCLLAGGSATQVHAQAAHGSYFGSAGSRSCYARTYTPLQLRKLGDQRIARIAIGSGPTTQTGAANSAAKFDLGVALQTRGSKVWYNGVAYCRTAGNAFQCSLESDGGTFRLVPTGRNGLRLTTSGITIEGGGGFLRTGPTKQGYLVNRTPIAICTGARAKAAG